MTVRKAPVRSPLTELENEVMSAVWKGGPSSVEAVHQTISLKRQLKEATTRTLLRRLELKGYLRHVVDGRTFVYHATEPARNLAARAVRRSSIKLCQSSVEEPLSGMVDAKVLSNRELDDLAKIIQEAAGRSQVNGSFTRMLDPCGVDRGDRWGNSTRPRIASARSRHQVWCGTLAAMLLLPAFSLWGPKVVIQTLPAIAVAPAIEPQFSGVIETSGLPEPTGRPPQIQPPVVAVTVDAPPANLLFKVYLLGAGLLLIRLIAGTMRAASLRNRAAREQGFLSSPECSSPLTVGWFRPAIILPPSWSEWPGSELNAVLAHEREHARQRDPLVQWLAALNRCVFWFHPLAWWLERKIALLAEEACDAVVVAAGHDPHDYSEYLLNQARAIQRTGTRIAPQGTAMGGSSLRYRIARLLESRPASSLSRKKSAVATALCCGAIGVFTACQLDRVEKPAPGQPTMKELMHRQADSNRQHQDKEDALMARAHSLT